MRFVLARASFVATVSGVFVALASVASAQPSPPAQPRNGADPGPARGPAQPTPQPPTVQGPSAPTLPGQGALRVPGTNVAPPLQPAGAQANTVLGPGASALATVEPDPLADALRPVPGGLTPDDAAKAAAVTRASVRTKQAELQAAQAKVDQAFVGFFPTVKLAAQYVHLSYVNNTFPGGIVGVQTPGPISIAPCPGGGGNCILDKNGKPAAAQALTIPTLQNQYSLTAGINVPISDYLLRLSQSYAAASHGEKAKRLDAEAEALGASADGRITYLNWVHGRGQTIVAHQSTDAARAHVVDAKHAFDAGLVSKADVLRLEAQVASSEQLEAQALAFEEVAAEQLRIVLGAPPDRPLTLGIDVMHQTATFGNEDLVLLNEQAMKKRLEIRALDETIYSLKKVEDVTAAGYLPRLDAFADGTYADPNPRYFLETNRWDFTWDVGVRLSWTINDTFTTLGAVSEAKANTLKVVETRAQIRDALRNEVASAASDAKKSIVTLDAADRGIAAAEESLRVRRELFKNGKATSVDLIDAENEATRARLARLDAHIGMMVAKARLDHALGRDIK